MSEPVFAFTTRAHPIAEIRVGDERIPVDPGRWDGARWDAADALWSGSEWLDVACDVRSFTCEYGRQRTTDRFVAGVATVVVDNRTGWADPMATDPAILQMRPGREIRLGVQHAVFGTRWLFHGFIDSVVPTYEPVDVDTVTFQCLDALGEVNRAKLVPLADPAYAGERADLRIGRILDLAQWDPDRRDLWGASDTLIADELGGQVADLLGQAADSTGGVIFGDTAGIIGFRPRDWQTYVPGTPDDGTIGNIGTGTPSYTIPGIPQVDGYLSPTVGIASTADAADLNITGDVRVTAKLRDDSVESATSRYAVLKGTSPSDLAYALLASFSTSWYALLGWPAGASSPQLGSILGLRTQWGMTPPGADVYVGALVTGVNPASQALTLATRGIRSTDNGGTWAQYGAIPANIRGDAMSRDATGPLRLGSTVLGAAGGWQGRIYWVQVEAINRARLVFPGSGGNFLSIPSAADQQIATDFEIVARVQAPPAGFPNGTVVAKNGSWYLWLNPTNISTGFTLTPSGTTFPGSSPHGFVPGNIYWIKATRVAATGAVAFYTAPDSPTEPTVWSKIGADVAGTAGTIAFPAIPITVGVYSTFASPFRGRVLRVICRQGIGGAAYLDVNENNAGTMATATTFVASSGQTVTVTASNKFVFPGVAGNYMTMPDAAPLRVTGDIEIVARVAPTDWTPAATNTVLGRWTDAGNQRSYLFRLATSGALQLNFTLDGVTGAPSAQSDATVNVADGMMRWVKCTRVAATGAVAFYTAPDDGTTLEPTTWTKLGTDRMSTSGPIFAGTAPLMVGAFQVGGAGNPWAGRISRVIVRNGIAGTIVADIAEHQSTVPGATSVAAVGGNVIATQTAGNTIIQLDPSMPIVQPQPTAVVWRFDANDYPGTGTSYVDPRGRTWTLSAAGAITPKVPAVPPVVVPGIPADVCPTSWTRPFDRASIATRVIVGRSLDTAQVFDDLAGQELYGIEPFERVDLLTELDSRIAEIGARFLETRGASTAPRVRSVAFDAATSPDALDLMTSVDVFKPSRYRCRLELERGIVFDEEMFATGVMHAVERNRWTLNLNLDAASPYEVAGGRWDGAWWNVSAWAAATAQLEELLTLVKRQGVSV